MADGVGAIETELAAAMRDLPRAPDRALAQTRAVLRTVPAHPGARLIEAQALRLSGDEAGAWAILPALAAEQPHSAAIALELGTLAAAIGDSARAITHLRRACALKPDMAPAWTALARALREAGGQAEADRADLAAIRAATGDPLIVRAALALSDGRLAEAEPLLRDRLRNRPEDVAALRMLGELAWRRGRTEEALALLRRTVELAPGFDAAREYLIRALGRANRLPEAIAQATILLDAGKADPARAMLKGSLLVRTGARHEALALYEDLVARHPQHRRAWLNLGHVRKTIGAQAGAVAAYRAAIALAPQSGEAWWHLADLKTVHLDAADIAAMTAALAQAEEHGDRLHLHFALARALEDAGEDARAFDHYARGNRLRRERLPYSADETTARCAGQIALFDRAFFAARAGEGCPSPDPIFVVGLPRSGSTLVEQILASHSMVEGTTELPDLMLLATRLANRETRDGGVDYAAALRALAPAERRRLGEEYIARTRIHRRTGKPFFIDKMPNNWEHVGLIRLILPNARIVDARRHPVGCCFSAWKQHFARGQAFSYDLADIGRYYRDYVALMAAFDAAAPGAVHRVIYERMVADTRGEVERLLAALDLPFEEACMAFWQTERAVRTASAAQVRAPIFAGAVDHWRRFAPWLDPLVAALGPVVECYPEPPPPGR